MRVLIADDDEISAELLRQALCKAGYEVAVARNGRDAFELVKTAQFRMLISDWEMPEVSGPELCRRIRARRSCGYVYILLLTSRGGAENIVEGLSAGADDFVTKPFHPHELEVRLRVGERILSLEGRDLIIFTLARLAESRDPETGAHLERIREYSRLLAEQLARRPRYRDLIDGDYVQMIYLTSPLHDIGKVGIPDAVLLKPGRLTPEEFEIMKEHAAIGAATLDDALSVHPDAEFLRMARDIAWRHHEKFDGSGYPGGLAGEEIPLCARIVALADVYDALTTKRVYKAAFTHADARQIIVDGRGKHFDPDVVDAFLALETRFDAVRRQFDDEREVRYLPSRSPAGPAFQPVSV
jgi:putative two-component system response regulator